MKKLTLNVNKEAGKQLEFLNDHSDSLDFLNNKQHHIGAKNSNLILSSSVGSRIYASGSLWAHRSLNAQLVLNFWTEQQYHMAAASSHLILSSSVGSIVAVSGAFKTVGMTNANKDTLTPQAGTVIWNTTSGSMQVYNGTAWKIVTVT